jgi:hypothetical protein
MVEVDAESAAVGNEINALPADADETTRQRLAERLAPTLAQNRVDYPWLRNPMGHLSKNKGVTHQTVIQAVVELYKSAQIDVLSRAGVLAQGLLQDGEHSAFAT